MRWSLVFFLFSIVGFGQEPIFFTLDEDKGLPNKTVYDILEDRDHFIWLATDSGIYKYDGNRFIGFSHPQQVGLSVFNLTLDHQNTIWYNNLSNQLFRIKEGETPEIFLNLNAYFKGENTKITSHQNFIIINGRKKLLIIDKLSGEILKSVKVNLKHPDIKPIFKGNTFFVLDLKNDWYSFNLTSFELKLHSEFSKMGIIPKHAVSGNIFQYNSAIYLLENRRTSAQIVRFSDRKLIPLAIEDAFYDKRIIESAVIDDFLWFSTTDGLFVYKIINDKLVLIKHLFKGKLITKVIKDVFENYWISSHDNGLFIIQNIGFNTIKKSVFKSDIKHHYNSQFGFFIQNINNGLFHFRTDSKSFHKIPHQIKNDIKYVFQNPYSQEININSLREGVTVFSEDYHYLNTKKVKGVLKDVHYLSPNTMISSANTFSGFYETTNTRKNFLKTNFEISGRSYASAYSKKFKKGYFANINGLFSVDSTHQTKELLHNGNSIFARKIVKNHNDEIWVLSFRDHILQFRNDSLVDQITLKKGLLNPINNHIYAYKDNLWILGNSGIQIYNTKTKKFSNITNKDGLPTYDFKGIYIDKDIAYISSTKEIIYFDINTYRKKIKILNPYITKVSYNGNDYDLTDSSEIHFPSKTEKVDVFFNTNGLFSKETIQYQYKLNNSHWENVNKGANVISFNRISSGTYDLKIKASYENLNSRPINMVFTINTPLYQKWYFIVSLILGSVFLVWYLWNKKANRLQQQQELKLQKQNQELENINLKLENLRSQMNPHFIFNALNSIQDYILKNETALARHFLVKFSRLIRIYLEHTQRDTLSLSEEVEALTLYLDLEKDRFSEDFNFEINADENINSLQIKLPPFLIQPYVENAIKHGLLHKNGNKNLIINFKLNNNDVLICEIIDDGIGYEKSAIINQKQRKHKSFSTNANTKRIQLLNKTRASQITLEVIDLTVSEIKSGTKVVLQIPQKKVAIL